MPIRLGQIPQLQHGKQCNLRHIWTILFSVVLPLSCISAPTYTSYFNNIRVYTNASLGGHLSLSGATNQLTDSGNQLLFNGFPIGGDTFNSTNLYVTNFFNTFSYISNLYVTNITANTTITTNITVEQNITIKGGGSLVLQTNTYITINGTNVAVVNQTDGIIPYRVSTNNFGDSTLSFADGVVKTSSNLGALLTVGDTTFVNLSKASQTNSVSGALTFAHATNGVHGLDQTHIRWLFVPSGGPHTLTVPSGWRTNVYSAVPPALTNGTIYRMVVTSGGPTADAASQTNCYVSFEYYK